MRMRVVCLTVLAALPVATGARAAPAPSSAQPTAAGNLRCPVDGRPVSRFVIRTWHDLRIGFCDPACAERFLADERPFVAGLVTELVKQRDDLAFERFVATRVAAVGPARQPCGCAGGCEHGCGAEVDEGTGEPLACEIDRPELPTAPKSSSRTDPPSDAKSNDCVDGSCEFGPRPRAARPTDPPPTLDDTAHPMRADGTGHAPPTALFDSAPADCDCPGGVCRIPAAPRPEQRLPGRPPAPHPAAAAPAVRAGLPPPRRRSQPPEATPAPSASVRPAFDGEARPMARPGTTTSEPLGNRVCPVTGEVLQVGSIVFAYRGVTIGLRDRSVIEGFLRDPDLALEFLARDPRVASRLAAAGVGVGHRQSAPAR